MTHSGCKLNVSGCKHFVKPKYLQIQNLDICGRKEMLRFVMLMTKENCTLALLRVTHEYNAVLQLKCAIEVVRNKGKLECMPHTQTYKLYCIVILEYTPGVKDPNVPRPVLRYNLIA